MSGVCLRWWSLGHRLYVKRIVKLVVNGNQTRRLSTILPDDQQRGNQSLDNRQRSGQPFGLRPKKQNIWDIIQLKVRYEDQFHEHRRHQLAPVGDDDYRRWTDTFATHSQDSGRTARQLTVICEIYNRTLERTYRVPTKLTDDMVSQLLELVLYSDITQQIHFWYDLEFRRWAERLRRAEEVATTQARLEVKHSGRTSRVGVFDDNNEIIYGLWHNTLFTRIGIKSRRQYIARTRLKNSALFGQKLVIDFGYENYLTTLSSKRLMSILSTLISFNKYQLNDSYDLHFSNLNPNGLLMKLMTNYFAKYSLNEQYISTSSESYLDHFDANKLCYICPQAREPLEHYDQDTIYVLPGVCHHSLDAPLNVDRVRREGISMKRIPTEEYGSIGQDFHIEIAGYLQILSNFRENNDISEALAQYLPNTIWKSPANVDNEDQEVIKRMFYMKKISSQSKSKIFRSIDDQID